MGGEGEMMKSARERELEKQNQKLQKELNTYKLHYCAAISQRDELAAELEESRECCKNYQESFSWKITKPFRFISRSLKKLIQKSSAGRYFLSGLRSLRKDGV